MWANDLVDPEISWWFPNILPLESGLIGMVPKNPATRARINRNGSHCTINNNFRPINFLRLDKAQVYLAEYYITACLLHI